jgi:histidinol-phosphate/aromatic aminotransferase/cobyric acid decarboxylase-like protein
MAREQSKVLTDYRVGTLQEELAIAALGDADHLPFLRKKTAEARAAIESGYDHCGATLLLPWLFGVEEAQEAVAAN